MKPVDVPQSIIDANPHLAVFTIGPPPSVSEEDCGKVQAQVGEWKENGVFDGAPMVRTFWKPSAEEIDYLQNHGGLVELVYYSDSMVITSINVEKGE